MTKFNHSDWSVRLTRSWGVMLFLQDMSCFVCHIDNSTGVPDYEDQGGLLAGDWGVCIPTYYYYHIAPNFLASKFSWMVVFDNFVEIILRIRCLYHAHAAHEWTCIWAWHTSKFYLVHTITPLSALELAAVSKAMPTLWYLFGECPLWIRQHVVYQCSSTWKLVHVQKIFVEVISQTVENSRNLQN